ncbi:MAG: hypothetical protein ABSH28_15780 [Acidobacteriota bacterium]
MFATYGLQLACDFYLPDQRLIVEYDERQHFTRPRALSLALYPSELDLGFDRAEWIRSCERTDAHDSSPAYRDEQRAYYDAVRDILAAQNGVRLVRLRHDEQDWTAPNAGEVLSRILEQAAAEERGWRSETVRRESDTKSDRGIGAAPMEGRASEVQFAARTAEQARSFKIGLLSFAVDKDHKERIQGNESVVLEILNSHPDLDLLVGAGWTLFSGNELNVVWRGNRNAHTVAFLETWKDDDGTFEHKGYAVRGQELIVKCTPQVFKTSGQINKNPDLMVKFFDELEPRRRLRIGNRSVTWLICGEINVLRNAQSDGNRVEFRFPHDRLLSDQFRRVFDETEIFVNPTHTTMGNQGKLAMRRAYLSAGARTFCSASNVDVTGRGLVDIRHKLGGCSVQYLWKDGRSQDPDDDEVQHTDQFIYRAYSV